MGMLFMAVPCIEEAMEGLGTLICLVERSQAANASALASKGQKIRKQKAVEAADEDEDFIMEDNVGLIGGDFDVIQEDSQELIEAAAIAEAPKPSAKASARPTSARRGRGSQQPESPTFRQEGGEGSPTPPASQEVAPQAPQSDQGRTDSTKSAKSARPPAGAPKTKKKKGT